MQTFTPLTTEFHVQESLPFQVAFSSNPGSTGYQWQVTAGAEGNLKVIDECFVAFPRPGGGFVGGDGQQVFTFKPLKAGGSTFTATLLPPGGGRPPAQTHVFQIVILPAVLNTPSK